MASERHLKEKEMKRITLETVGLTSQSVSLRFGYAPFHINSLSFLFVVMWERNVKRIRMKNPVGAGSLR